MAVNTALWFTFPSFGEASRAEFSRNLRALRRKAFHVPEALDFESFGEMEEGRAERELDDFCSIAFRQNRRVFDSEAWIRLFMIHEPVVREYVWEFLASIKFMDTTSELDQASTLVFQLGGARRDMNLRGFAIALGLYTFEETNDDLFGAFRSICVRKRPQNFNPTAYVTELTGNHGYDSKNPPSYIAIRSPICRLVHRLISCSISARHSSKEKVTVDDLFFLHSMDGGDWVDVPWNVAYFLAEKAKGIKSSSKICGTHIIGRLARYFGLMGDDMLNQLSVEHDTRLISPSLLVRMEICEYNVLGEPRMIREEMPNEDNNDDDDDDDEEEAQEEVARRPNMTTTNRLTAMDTTLLNLRGEVDEIRYTVSGMSEQYDQFYGEFRGFRDVNDRHNTWQTDHLSKLLEHSHISHTRFDNTMYTYVPDIPDIGVQQGTSFRNQGDRDASNSSFQQFSSYGHPGAGSSHMDE